MPGPAESALLAPVAVYLKLPAFALVLSRLAGLVAFAPILGSLAIPATVRALLAAGIAALLAPIVTVPADLPDTPGGLVLGMAQEAALGLLMGLVMALCFLGMQVGSTLVAQESGLAIGQLLDPSFDEEQTVLSTFYVQLAVAIYLIIGGHRVLLSTFLDTFEAVPLLRANELAQTGTGLLLRGLTVGAMGAVRVAAPALVTLFLVNVAMGFIARTVPQLNVITVGFSLKTLLGFAIVAATLPSAVSAFIDAVDLAAGWLKELGS
jgi:flagellar biosynthetic protein FliR